MNIFQMSVHRGSDDVRVRRVYDYWLEAKFKQDQDLMHLLEGAISHLKQLDRNQDPHWWDWDSKDIVVWPNQLFWSCKVGELAQLDELKTPISAIHCELVFMGAVSVNKEIESQKFTFDRMLFTHAGEAHSLWRRTDIQ